MPLATPIRTWLWTLWALVLLMVVVGGTTRLTGSGLSMVDWHPLMGALPPLTEAEWLRVFERYQESPQYQQVNHWMALSDFKRIFFWEYLHRLLGRLIGVVFTVPFVVFLVRRQLRGAWIWRALSCLALGGGQGLLGWYMVRSGLVDRPEVSHYRLAAHLTLAFGVGQWLLWLALQAGEGQGARPTARASAGLRAGTWGFVALLGLQIVWGAFMAGKRAGLLASTFPDMNGAYGPARFFTGSSVLSDLLDNPLAIHWTHRALGFVVLAAAVVLWAAARHASGDLLRRRGLGVLHLTVAQVALGAITVIWHVPTTAAVAHQGCAYLLLSAAVRMGHASRA